MDPTAVHQVMFDMAWVSDPTAWLGLLTLVAIEIVLGIDNLVFIAILTAKLPEKQRDMARYIGLAGALGIRLVMLACISLIVNMIEPLFYIGSKGITGRDIILLIGGVFLLYKSVHELHSKLEGFDEELSVSKAAGSAMYLVILQIGLGLCFLYRFYYHSCGHGGSCIYHDVCRSYCYVNNDHGFTLYH